MLNLSALHFELYYLSQLVITNPKAAAAPKGQENKRDGVFVQREEINADNVFDQEEEKKEAANAPPKVGPRSKRWHELQAELAEMEKEVTWGEFFDCLCARKKGKRIDRKFGKPNYNDNNESDVDYLPKPDIC